MTLHPRLSRATVALVKRFETFQPTAERTPCGGWSVGYGHTASAREGARVSPDQAEALLTYDLDRAARAVERALFAPVTQGQFEALTALCFNLGEPAFLRSTALARLNAGAELEAADEIERWRQAELGAGTQVVDALVRRRAAEKAHFLGLPEGTTTWPSAQRRPLSTPGGEMAEPAVEVECPTSAALTAVNGVQARLRRLIPDEAQPKGPPEPVAPEAVPAEPVEPAIPQDAAPELEDVAADLSQAVSVAPMSTSMAAPMPEEEWESRPPPFDPPVAAFARSATSFHALTLPPSAHDPAVAPEGAPAPAPPQDVAPAEARPGSSRAAYVLAGLLGIVAFAVGVLMILGGRPSLLNLALGAAGALLAMAGLYGLLGAPRPASPRHGPDSPPARADRFHQGPPDTK